MLSAHVEERELAMTSFEYAGEWSRRAGIYNTLATVLAVGLAFAAWASLMKEAGCLRRLFTLISALVLLACLGFLSFHVLTREPLEEYVALADHGDHAFCEQLEPVPAEGPYVHPSALPVCCFC